MPVFEWFKLSANSERRSPSVSTSLLAVPSVFSFSSSEFSSPANLYPHSKNLIIAYAQNIKKDLSLPTP